MKCPNCQFDNREGRGFCSECGKPLQARCPSCQAVNEPGEKFCGECGHPLVEEPALKPSTPTSPEPTSFAGGRYQVKKKPTLLNRKNSPVTKLMTGEKIWKH